MVLFSGMSRPKKSMPCTLWVQSSMGFIQVTNLRSSRRSQAQWQ